MAEISSDIIRGFTDTMILNLLLDGPSYAYALSKQITERCDGKYVIKETTLYSAVTRLEKNGWVTSEERLSEIGKRRTYYFLTEKGREYYRDKCSEWKLTREVVEKFIKD